MATLICPKCDKNFDSDKLRVYKCPDCKKWLDWGPDVEVQKYEPEELVRDEFEDLDPATKALVRAANRTTDAVRSLAIYLFIAIATGFCGGLLFLIGRPEAALFGAIVILIGFVWAVAAGLSELSKSRP